MGDFYRGLGVAEADVFEASDASIMDVQFGPTRLHFTQVSPGEDVLGLHAVDLAMAGGERLPFPMF